MRLLTGGFVVTGTVVTGTVVGGTVVTGAVVTGGTTPPDLPILAKLDVITSSSSFSCDVLGSLPYSPVALSSIVSSNGIQSRADSPLVATSIAPIPLF